MEIVDGIGHMGLWWTGGCCISYCAVGGGLSGSSMSFNFTFIPLTNEVDVRDLQVSVQ